MTAETEDFFLVADIGSGKKGSPLSPERWLMPITFKFPPEPEPQPTSQPNTTTTWKLPNGETILLKGLFESKGTIEERVPVLSRIPMLGRLFKDTGLPDKNRNLIIFLTPRIITTDEE